MNVEDYAYLRELRYRDVAEVQIDGKKEQVSCFFAAKDKSACRNCVFQHYRFDHAWQMKPTCLSLCAHQFRPDNKSVFFPILERLPWHRK